MSFEIIPIIPFQRQAKRLLKKFPSLKNDIFQLIQSLKENPMQGTPLGSNCYKVRLSIASKNKGKSGGARVLTCVYVADKELYLLSIYDKSERSSMSDSEIRELIELVSELKK